MNLDSVEILRSLVAFPTLSRESNLPLIDWIRNYLADLRIDSHLVLNSDGTKSNHLATIGPLTPGGLVLSGHTDVVPVDGQTWHSEPFCMTIRGSRLYGRGVCDMKGFIAAVLARVPDWKHADLCRPVHLMLSYDEEVGCLGVSSLIDVARQKMQPPAAVIVGEPTGMRLATQHKRMCLAKTYVSGIEAHSSLTHRGESAVMLAADLIAHLGSIARDLASDAFAGEQAFEPPCTTISANRIIGGTANNILASQCEFMWDIRALPGQDSRTIVHKLASYAELRLAQLLNQGKRCRVKTVVLYNAPPLKAEGGGLAAELVRAVAGSREGDFAVAFSTEAGYFQHAGWSTVVCGPGSIEQAHRPDEYVEGSQLTDCETILDRLVYLQLVQR